MKYDIIPSQARFASRFVTSTRNLILYWIAQFTVLTTYSSLAYLVILGTREYGQSSLLITIGMIFLTIFFAFPVIISLMSPTRWKLGLGRREPLIIVSSLVASPLLLNTDQLSLPIAIFSSIWILTGLVWVMSTLPFWHTAVSISIVAFITSSISFLAPSVFDNSIYSRCLFSPSMGRECGALYWTWFIICIFITAYAIYRLVQWWNSNNERARQYVLPIGVFIFFTEVSLFLVTYTLKARWLNLKIDWSQRSDLIAIIAIIGLVMLFIAAYPTNFLNNQISYLRAIFFNVRKDHIYSRFSPFIVPRSFLNNFFNYTIPKFFSINNSSFFIPLSLVVGGIGVPSTIYLLSRPFPGGSTTTTGWQSSVPPIQLMTIGLTSTFIFLVIYFFTWLISNRSRYVVMVFETDSNDETFKPELDSIAKLSTHILVDELQKVAALLKQRQVENLHFIREDSNAFFVTSGVEQEFLDQMQEVVSLEIPSAGRLDLGRFVNWIMQLLARIQVRGKVQRRTNSTIEIWVEVKYRNNRSAAVDMITITENSLEELDEVMIRPVAHELALKLLLELGQIPHLGSSWETLDYFLKGLDASANKKWLQAISFYRQALQAEETIQGSFGIGHYHLGTALLYQGNWREGYDHLKTAEADGPPMAELQYMLALALLYIYWGEIHTKPNVLQEIDYRCAKAASLRKNFAEVFQLRGTAYFRAARNQDRENSKPKKNAINQPVTNVNKRRHLAKQDLIPKDYYQIALKYYSKALRMYDYMYRNVSRQPGIHTRSKSYTANLLQQRMTAAHQLGDALRSLGRYAEAESYYQDVSLVFPLNIRNLADLAKTYCLAQNWQCGEEYLWRQAYKYPVAEWDADIAIHTSWIISGGIYDHYTTPLKSWVDRQIMRLLRREANDQQLGNYSNEDAAVKQLFGESIAYIDFALYQRPRYVEAWRQSNWISSLKQAYDILTKKEQISRGKVAFDRFQFSDPEMRHYSVWLGLRLRSYEESFYLDHTTKADIDSLEACTKFNLREILDKLINYRKRTIQLDQESRKDGSEAQLQSKYKYLVLAQELVDLWEETYFFYDGSKTSEESIDSPKLTDEDQMTFAGRWHIDMFYEITLITCRVLAETEMYEKIFKVASSCIDVSEKWLDLWQKDENYGLKDDPIKKYQTFSPYVSRYQRASIYAWLAYGLFYCFYNRVTQSRLNTIQAEQLALHQHDHSLLDSIQKQIDTARKLIPPHPLCLYVQALVYRQSGLEAEAIEVLEQLLDVITPFDPKRDVGGSVLGMSSPSPTTSDTRNNLYHMEKVCGRQQFHNIVNPTNIHSLLAEIYSQQDKSDLSVRHLMDAVRWSLHPETKLELFLQLADQLNSMERYDEAEAVIDNVISARPTTDFPEYAEIAYSEAMVQKCVVDTRRMYYARSLQRCKEIAHSFKFRGLEDYLRSFSSIEHPSSQSVEERKLSNDFNSSARQIINFLARFIKKSDEPQELEYTQALFADILQNSLHESSEFCFEKGNKKEEFEFRLSDLIGHATQHTPKESFTKKEIKQGFESPKVFLAMDKDSDKLIDEASQLSLFLINDVALTSLFKNPTRPNRLGSLSEEYSLVMLSHATEYFSRLAYSMLNQFADICNVLAFNRIETGIHASRFAYGDSECSRVIMAYLVQASDRDTKPHKICNGKLAQYCDTIGWIYYKDSFVSRFSTTDLTRVNMGIERADKFLRQGIRYDPTRAIIHYHLANIYLSRVELIWQSAPESVSNPSVGSQAHCIDNFLKQAFQEWRNARDFDQFGRIHNQLVSLHKNISKYQKVWGNRQQTGIAGI